MADPIETPSRLFPSPLAIVMILCAIAAGGCQKDAAIQPGDIRTYSIPRVATVPVVSRNAPPPPADASPRVRYDLPEGWADEGASGLRLATLLIGSGSERQEVTVIPASGTLESNVARWAGQLDEAADEPQRLQAAAEAIAAAERIDVDGSQATVVLLLGPAATAGDDAGEAILGAMVPIEGSSSLFVKYKGRVDIARRERENFHRFVSSLRWN
jgi:hypothetical protein